MSKNTQHDPLAAARAYVKKQRETWRWTLREAAHAGGGIVQAETWRMFESGQTGDLTKKMHDAVMAAFRVGEDWADNPPPIQPRSHAPEPEPADPHETLAEILRLLQNHRDSDVAPSARLMDMPTRVELQAEMVAAIDAVFRRVDENNTRLVETIGAVLAAVEKNDERLAALEARPPAVAADPSSRTRSRQTHTARSEQGPRKRPD